MLNESADHRLATVATIGHLFSEYPTRRATAFHSLEGIIRSPNAGCKQAAGFAEAPRCCRWWNPRPHWLDSRAGGNDDSGQIAGDPA